MISFKHGCYSKINEPPNDREVQESILSNNATIDRKLEFSNKNTDNAVRLSSVLRDLQSNTYQIKMYWERGMAWQESYREMSWCAECEDDDCTSGSYVVIKECNDRKPDQKWIFEDSRIKPYINPDVCLTAYMNGDPEARTMLRTCYEPREAFQKFYLYYSSNVFALADKFQIKTNLYDRDDLCISTEHHPSKGEKLKFMSCTVAQRNDYGVYDDTSHWVVGEFDA